MGKEVIKRLELLEIAAHERRLKEKEAAKRLDVKLINNTATLWHGGKVLKGTAGTPFAMVKLIEDYILETKPEFVNIGVELSGVCDLIPGLEESEAGRELDLYFMTYGGISGDYYSLLESNENITLANIILCEVLICPLRGSGADEEMGVTQFFKDSAECLTLAHDISLLVDVLADRVKKYKEYRAKYENSTDICEKYIIECPRNRWSRFWNDAEHNITYRY